MPTFLIRDVRILNPGRDVNPGDVLIRGGRIVAAGLIPHAALSDVKEAVCIDGKNRLLTPGLIDLHTGGIVDRLHEAGPVGLRAAARELCRFGVTTAVPTLTPANHPRWLEQLAETVQALCSVREVHIPGLHLTGPFTTTPDSSDHTDTGNLSLLEALLGVCGDRIAAMSVSPDAPGILPVIQRLRSATIPVFLTPSRASAGQINAALEAGATHFHGILSAPGRVPPRPALDGRAHAILRAPRPTSSDPAECSRDVDTVGRSAIPDGSWAGATLISGTTGSPRSLRGERCDGDPPEDGRAMNYTLAGLLQGLRLPAHQTWAMATLNPAEILGLERKGRLQPGADADLVLWEEDFTPALTWVAGECTFTKTKTPPTVPVG